jgi:hypothetical protein
MNRYTTDAVGFVRYLVDELGKEADRLYSRAERGEVIIELPGIAAAETLYRIQKGHPAKGVDLPVTLVETTVDDLDLIATARGSLSLHEAMIVASHRTRETEAVITTDTDIDDHGATVVWD